jgi:hypothetical protein
MQPRKASLQGKSEKMFEDQGLPIAHGGGIGLTMAFAIG